MRKLRLRLGFQSKLLLSLQPLLCSSSRPPGSLGHSSALVPRVRKRTVTRSLLLTSGPTVGTVSKAACSLPTSHSTPAPEHPCLLEPHVGLHRWGKQGRITCLRSIRARQHSLILAPSKAPYIRCLTERCTGDGVWSLGIPWGPLATQGPYHSCFPELRRLSPPCPPITARRCFLEGQASGAPL